MIFRSLYRVLAVFSTVSLATAYHGSEQARFTVASQAETARTSASGTASYKYNASEAQSLHLSSIGSTDFTTLSHPDFPNTRIRVKKTNFCDSTVKPTNFKSIAIVTYARFIQSNLFISVFTGYLDVDAGAKHMFFYFFESRRDPEKDDVIMWINGGPGCSSATGLLMELGPCSIDMKNISSNGTLWNPYSWNSEANIFFLDQPVGVGFSYADYGETVETTEDAAKNVHAFITIFFDTFTQFSGRTLHLSGESYGGRYLPVFASEIYDKNQVALREGGSVINLQSVLIGNGITDISTLYQGRYEVECGTASLPVPFQSISTCVRMKTALPRCQKAMRQHCVDLFDSINCQAAVNFCDSELSTAMHASGRNVYDITKPCEGELCYREMGAIKAYLNLPETQELLGVKGSYNFEACSQVVGRNFAAHLDKWAVHTQDYVANLLDRGVRILIYAGTYDWQCNYIANQLWVDKLEWSGQSAYKAEEWRDWTVGGAKAGEVRETPLLTFATIRGAGHMMSIFF